MRVQASTLETDELVGGCKAVVEDCVVLDRYLTEIVRTWTSKSKQVLSLEGVARSKRRSIGSLEVAQMFGEVRSKIGVVVICSKR